MTAPRVRSATVEDVAPIGALAERAGLFPSDMAAEIFAPSQDGASDIWLVADQEGTLSGFAFCEQERMADRVWNMLALGVDPSAHRRGIGRALTAAMIARLTGQNARMVIVETSSLPAQQAARAFYPALGFELEGRVRDFYAAGEDKVIFRKPLVGDGAGEGP